MPTRQDLDSQLDVLAERGKANGAVVEYFGKSQLEKKAPQARSATNRALWSPNTAVVKPITVVKRLQHELKQRGVSFIMSTVKWTVEPEYQKVILDSGEKISYRHLFNSAGLQADRVARYFGTGLDYTILPFKGLYWQLKKNCPIQPTCNLYPVPDLNVPFLGVHFTPSADSIPLVSIGPTATPAFGRENYRGFHAMEIGATLENIALLARQYLADRGSFRRYVHEQAFLALPPLLLRSAQQLIPSIRAEHLELSHKVGIRSQLFNRKTQRLEDDFICLQATNSTHILNAISPAFTASFALADLILDESESSMVLA